MKTPLPPAACCAWCLTPLDVARSVGAEARPSAGDISFCIRCGKFSVFADDLMLRQPTDWEEAKISGFEVAQRIIAAWKKHKPALDTAPDNP
jgi:hypothetical protein